VDPTEGLAARLAETHCDLVVRFRDLELGCARVPDPLESEEDAATLTDFIGRCRGHIKKAEVTHKQKKELFLKAFRAVAGFFKRRCEKLTAALAPVVSRLKADRDIERLPMTLIAAKGRFVVLPKLLMAPLLFINPAEGCR